MAKPIVKRYEPCGSPIILVFTRAT